MDGLIRLLHHIEADLGTRGQDAEYYGSPILDAEEKMDLIQSVQFITRVSECETMISHNLL